jgi:hypothetical protein
VWPFRKKKVVPWVATLQMGTRQEVGLNRVLRVRIDIIKLKKGVNAQKAAETAEKFFNGVNSGGFRTQAYISSVTRKNIVLWLVCLIDDDVSLEWAWDLVNKVLQEAAAQFNGIAVEMAKLGISPRH